MDELSPQIDTEDAWGNHEKRVFKRLYKAGFQPKSVYDVGAADGGWAGLLNEIYPNAAYELFEPLANHRESYRKNLREYTSTHSNMRLHPYALGEETKLLEMRLHPDGYSSTTLPIEHSEYAERLVVQQYKLDEYVATQQMLMPDILKIDAQGAERLILQGAHQCLFYTNIVFAETWLTRGYGPKTPLVTEIKDYLEEFGFELVEIGAHAYTRNHCLYGFDAYFMKRELSQELALRMPTQQW